jgi:hypothetical protein
MKKRIKKGSSYFEKREPDSEAINRLRKKTVTKKRDKVYFNKLRDYDPDEIEEEYDEE